MAQTQNDATIKGGLTAGAIGLGAISGTLPAMVLSSGAAAGGTLAGGGTPMDAFDNALIASWVGAVPVPGKSTGLAGLANNVVAGGVKGLVSNTIGQGFAGGLNNFDAGQAGLATIGGMVAAGANIGPLDPSTAGRVYGAAVETMFSTGVAWGLTQ